MNLKNFLLTIAIAFSASTSVAQVNLLNARTADEIHLRTEEQIAYDNDRPLPYGYVDPRDVLWAKTVWERIDLRERMNFPLYFPVENIGPDRRSLYDVLMENIRNGRIENIYADSYLTDKRNLQEIEATIRRVDTTDYGIQLLNAGQTVDPEYIDIRELSAADIEEYRVRGYWYIDKRLGELKYRIIAIAPCARDVNFIDDEDGVLVELFWVFIPEAREVLHEYTVFNPNNSARPITFDHLLNSRRFSGVIYRTENEFGDRDIEDYIHDNALMQLLESNRLREVIRNIELDLWQN